MTTLERREATVEHYLDNYRDLREQGEFGKAGEALWGVVSNLVEATAWAQTGSGLGGFVEQKQFVRQLSGETDDELLYETYKDAETLHVKGFYERLLDREEFARTADRVERELLPRLRDRYDRTRSDGSPDETNG